MLPDRARPPARASRRARLSCAAQGVTCRASSAARSRRTSSAGSSGGWHSSPASASWISPTAACAGCGRPRCSPARASASRCSLDRGLDLGAAEHAGRPLAWLHPALGSPALHEPHGHRLAAHLRRRPRHDLRPRPLRAARPRGRGLRPARPGLAPPRREPARAPGVARRRVRARDRGRDAAGPPLRREPAPRAPGVDAARRDEPRPRGPRDERGLPARAARGPVPLQLRLPGREPGLGAPRPRPSRSGPATRPRAPASPTTCRFGPPTPGFAEQVFFHEPRRRRGRPGRRRDRQPRARLRRVRALARGGAAGARPLEDDRRGRVRVRPRALDPRHDARRGASSARTARCATSPPASRSRSTWRSAPCRTPTRSPPSRKGSGLESVIIPRTPHIQDLTPCRLTA